MNKTTPLILSLLLIFLVSGCTQAGRIINESAELPNETGAMQVTPKNETEQNISTAPTEPQNITQPEACPETCNDGNNCTYGYCSEDTGYECVHAIRICLNSVETCPDGVNVSCKNMCINNSCTSCEPDCSEHLIPECTKQCGECEILDTERCECARITERIPNDNCCPEGCNYTEDNDCKKPECNESWECGNWSECINGTQNKTCIDINSCNMTERIETRECQEPEGEGYVIINEIMYDPSTTQGSDYYNEWVELYNPTDYDVDLSDWVLCGNFILSGYISYPDRETLLDSGTVILADGYALITDGGSGTEVYDNFNVSFDSVALHVDTASICGMLHNINDTIVLKHANGTIIDSVTYFKEWGANGNGKTLMRSGDMWTESTSENGTPGSQNSV